MKDEQQCSVLILPTSSRILISARVAQLMERWSYKPEVEGLSPSLGTKNKDAGGRMTGCREYEVLLHPAVLPTAS